MNNVHSNGIKYSIIMILDEANNEFVGYLNTLVKIFSEQDGQFELVIIANGGERLLRAKGSQLQALNRGIKCFAFKRRTADAVCLKVGLKETSGEIVFVTGSYQQITDDSLRSLLRGMQTNSDVAVPWRQDRVDPWLNRLQSKGFNSIVRKAAGSELHDLSCNTRFFRRKVLEDIDFYGGMFRFLPILASMKGYKSLEVKCKHFEERGKIGLYGFVEYITRMVEIFTLYFNTRFTRKPLRFFNAFGLFFIILGFFTFSYVILQKIIWDLPMGGRAVLLLGILFLVIGAQAASVGLLGEIVAFTHGRNKRDNLVEKRI